MYGKGIRARRGRIFGAALAAAVVSGLGAPGPAHADTFIPLPGGSITRQLADGTTLTVRITGESAKISPSMGDTPVHRTVWTTAVASVDLDGPSASNATVKVSPGYVVGCQVDISGLNNGTSGGVTITPSQIGSNPNNPFAGISPTQSLSEGITLGPGQATARLLLDIEKPDDYGQESHKRYNKATGPHASVSWTDEEFEVNGCGGYAQARSFVAAEVDTTTFIGNLVLFGEPFSMG
ncbi:MspA family porin [Nocardia sp. CDC160]|uniref:MspA family porin n=1 Tax=Nocardia sp. CDC160 TaxID=3112166 RepID=UPI002DB90808|nr:MspA family porin [Nocardia sp. CDC160]MEC3912976.1 MspA family porin [Nocardia sp. CDC160]